jgi:exonuclease SbcC
LRPERLEIEGFASFRGRTIVDFADAELFVLFGPTGAGKSSIIDAITFALYGTIPRYGDARLVAPIISQGMNEARIRLDFTLGGERYSAVRVVRRTAKGATTREARLEHAGRTLAGSADELTVAIEKLLGLPFQHFTRCVVLPQGDFADFLHATSGERQELLIKLLGLDVYRRIAQAANQRGSESANRAALIGDQLAGRLACATDEALADARARVDRLAALLETVEAEGATLTEHQARRAAADAAAAQAEQRVTLLEQVRIPPRIEGLARDLAALHESVAATASALEAAATARESADAARAALPERARISALLEKHDALTRLRADFEAAADAAAQARTALERSAVLVEWAEKEAALADDAQQRVRRDRAAAHLAGHLHVGEPCPVCLRPVDEVPAHSPPPELEAARIAVERAVDDVTRARAEHQTAQTAFTRREAESASAQTALDRLTADIATAPPRAAAAAQLAEVIRLDAAAAESRQSERCARESHAEARSRWDALASHEAAARRAILEVCQQLAEHGLAAPPARLEDLHQDWAALVAWAEARSAMEGAAADRQRAAAQDARRAFETLAAAQLKRLADAGIALGRGQEPRTGCGDALAAARAAADQLAGDVETARALRADVAVLEKHARLARELGKHLDARNFERWLMNRALRTLVAGATRVLLELSGGAYSLALDDRNDFLVIDHGNADEPRLARTLSGGETFLASLALALALAEHVADLAASGAARLDALFLDEGFGTLDADTLDTVATAIEELGSRGRMVGLVTHVRDLAERIPVRFEVRKVGSVSSVERIAG